MAIIRWRTQEEHEQADLFGSLDGVRISYNQFKEIHERICLSNIGNKIKKISYNKLLIAVQQVESQLINEKDPSRIKVDGFKGAPVTVKLSIMKMGAGIATIHLFFPITGRSGNVINLVFKKLGFSDNVLNGGSLKLDIPMEG